MGGRGRPFRLVLARGGVVKNQEPQSRLEFFDFSPEGMATALELALLPWVPRPSRRSVFVFCSGEKGGLLESPHHAERTAILSAGENQMVISPTLCSAAEKPRASFSAKDGVSTIWWREQKGGKGTQPYLISSKSMDETASRGMKEALWSSNL